MTISIHRTHIASQTTLRAMTDSNSNIRYSHTNGGEPSHDNDQTILLFHLDYVLFLFFPFPILWVIMVDPCGDLSTIRGPVNQVRRSQKELKSHAAI
ncbi:hypothetical protein BJY01DRAFT_212556 [Aspergillus pseudoustus]|uniref:Uncharacterized protein n=1 Tax=Aspergillus pseudoustus TaxID=1810923 RepID=A0ABR4K542_9EURO